MANVTYTVQNKNGSYDGDMVVKQYTSMAIDAGDTVTVDQPCRGLMILCTGDCTINGTLSMKERGPYANPSASGANDSGTVSSNGLQLPFLTASGTDSLTAANTLMDGFGTLARSVVANFKTIASNGTIVTTPRVGGTGGGSRNSGGAGNSGNTVTNGTGGGGGGAGFHGHNSGAGASGTVFSGGSGGGGSQGAHGSSGTDYGGPGGSANSGGYNNWSGGGAGNPAGNNRYNGGYSGGGPTTAGGLGGLLILLVKGNLTIGSGGSITAQGGAGAVLTNTSGSYSSQYQSGGGSGGGGRIIIGHKGTYTNNGTVTADGGQSTASRNDSVSGRGGYGGNGAVTVLQIK